MAEKQLIGAVEGTAALGPYWPTVVTDCLEKIIRLAADWPPAMQIVQLMSQDHMNNKQYVGKAGFLVFWTLNQHCFLGQLQEKKLGTLAFNPQVSSQAQVQPQLRQQQQQHLQQQKSQQQKQRKTVGAGKRWAFVQGSGRSQITSPGKMASQEPGDIGGGGSLRR